MKRTRGQALVLFVLLMLTGLLMAMMTIGLTERARERIELQMAADHAAWSNAVATAYALNGTALLLRTQIAHYVAVAGVQSLVSFAGTYRGYLNAMETYYRLERDRQERRCNRLQPCGCTGRDELEARIARVVNEHLRIKSFWAGLDRESGEQLYGSSIINLGLLGMSRENVQEYLVEKQLTGAILAERVATEEGGTSRKWHAVPTNTTNLREVGGGGEQDGAVLGRHTGGNMHGIWAVMGSRGNPFVTARHLSHIAVEQRLRAVVGSPDAVVFGHYGTSYFSRDLHGNGKWDVSGYAAWADDHGVIGMRYQGGGCNANARVYQVTGYVKSTDLSDDTDEHVWRPVDPMNPNGPQDPLPGFATHTSSVCTAKICPAMFFAFQDYNQKLLTEPEDVFGQPKNYAVLRDDRAGRPLDPWNLAVRLQLSVSSNGQELDMRDRSSGSALSAGIAYYHRRAHFKEPPNLFNPFWRAGLVRADIDQQARDNDLRAAYGAADPQAGEAFGRLYAAGYRGIP